MKGIIKKESVKIAEIGSSRRHLQRNTGRNWLNTDVMTSVISAGFWCTVLRTDGLKRIIARTRGLVQQLYKEPKIGCCQDMDHEDACILVL